jgi:hypothetical protein
MECRKCLEQLIPGHIYLVMDDDSVLCAKCCNQPDSSKREDFATFENPPEAYKTRAWHSRIEYKRRCGTRNIDESQ